VRTVRGVPTFGTLRTQPAFFPDGERVGVDFITDFPESASGNDCVVTLVDYLTKRVHCRACKKTLDAAGFAMLFIDNVVRLHGIPKEVVSDRDVRFQDFWTAVTQCMGTQLLRSTAFHPQTDGLAEMNNKTVTKDLKAFTTHCPEDWDGKLPLAEFAYNRSTHRSTKMTPFRLDLGWDPDIVPSALAAAALPPSGRK
jgi:hypothetical protein